MLNRSSLDAVLVFEMILEAIIVECRSYESRAQLIEVKHTLVMVCRGTSRLV